jgi:hypothetical protein
VTESKRAAILLEGVLASVNNDPAEALSQLTSAVIVLAAISECPRVVLETARAALDGALDVIDQPVSPQGVQ